MFQWRLFSGVEALETQLSFISAKFSVTFMNGPFLIIKNYLFSFLKLDLLIQWRSEYFSKGKCVSGWGMFSFQAMH